MTSTTTPERCKRRSENPSLGATPRLERRVPRSSPTAISLSRTGATTTEPFANYHAAIPDRRGEMVAQRFEALGAIARYSTQPQRALRA